MIPLLLSDPVGDDYGLGYAYPRAAVFAEAGFADLTGFEALLEGENVVLRVRLNRYPNPGDAPNGFSLATVAVYVDIGEGGPRELPGAGFRTPQDQGWDRAYLITGWIAEERRPDGQTRKVTVRKNGEWLELRPALAAGDHGYYVATGLYDPFTPWHFRPVRPGGGAWVIDAPVGSPPAVDVLSKTQVADYRSGELNPVRAAPSRLPWAVLTGAVGLLVLLLAFRFPRR